MSNLVDHARKELELAGYFYAEKDGINAAMAADVIALIELFANQGHSGMSAPFTVGLFTRLASYGTMTPLTGEDDEWNDVSDHMERPLWQNKRCSRVFKGEDGVAYDQSAIIFEDKEGFAFTNKDSSRAVTFPYSPTQETIKTPK